MQLASTISLWRRRSVLAAAIGIAELVVPDTGSSAADLGAAQSQRGFAARTGSLFTAVPSDPYAAPRITEIGIPTSPGRMRSGVLPDGTIGVTSGSASPPTAASGPHICSITTRAHIVCEIVEMS
jgi:hypothetical protein